MTNEESSATLEQPSDAPLTRRVYVRLGDYDYSLLLARATSLSLSVSDFVRLLLSLPIDFYDAESDPEPPLSLPGRTIVSVADLTLLRKAIDRWGVNLNQGTRAINALAQTARRSRFRTEQSRRELGYFIDQASQQIDQAMEGLDYIERRLDAIQDGSFLPVSFPYPMRRRG